MIEIGYYCEQVGGVGVYGNEPSNSVAVGNTIIGYTTDVPDPDICKEICGDGKDFGSYECDDGNL